VSGMYKVMEWQVILPSSVLWYRTDFISIPKISRMTNPSI
jgi:hypothetical protein